MGGIFGKKKKADKGAGKAAAAATSDAASTKDDNSAATNSKGSKKATETPADAEPASTKSKGSGKTKGGKKANGGGESRRPKAANTGFDEDASFSEGDVDIADAIVAAQKKVRVIGIYFLALLFFNACAFNLRLELRVLWWLLFVLLRSSVSALRRRIF
jgi:hypothetical protein